MAQRMAPWIDVDVGVRMYSAFYVVRSRCSAPNLHTDWDDAVGTNAFTLLAPLEDYPTTNFQMLYQDASGSRELRRYRYRPEEAVVFTSRFYHSTEPGVALGGAAQPHAFLCFTFGSDKVEHWPTIAPTISGYQSRVLRRWDGSFALTEIGEYLRDQEEGGGSAEDPLVRRAAVALSSL